MELKVISCVKKSFKDPDSNSERTYYKLYCADINGDIGSITSRNSYKAGDVVKLEAVVNRDGRFTLRIPN